jgi:hypothetical protein
MAAADSSHLSLNLPDAQPANTAIARLNGRSEKSRRGISGELQAGSTGAGRDNHRLVIWAAGGESFSAHENVQALIDATQITLQ